MHLMQKSIILLILFVTPSLVFSDTVYLRNGRRLHGQIVGQSRTSIIFLKRGRRRKISKRKIKRITYGATVNERRRKRELRRRIARARRMRKAAKRQAELDKLKREENRQKSAMEQRKQTVERLAAAMKKYDKLMKQLEKQRKEIENAQKVLNKDKKKPTGPEKRKSLPKRHGLAALWRSTLIPGWGQYYNGQIIRGAGYLAGIASLGLMANRYRADHSNAVDDLGSVRNLIIILPIQANMMFPTLYYFSRAEELSGNRDQAANRFRWTTALLLGLYLFNIIDTQFFTPAPAEQPNKSALRQDDWRVDFQLAKSKHNGKRDMLYGVMFSVRF